MLFTLDLRYIRNITSKPTLATGPTRRTLLLIRLANNLKYCGAVRLYYG